MQASGTDIRHFYTAPGTPPSMLVDRLVSLGYTRRGGGAYAHPDHHAVFVGDLIDRGPRQRETLELVKARRLTQQQAWSLADLPVIAR